MKKYDVIIIGCGVFGVTTAIELAKRKYKVLILESQKFPNPLAASNDITKAVRMEYGSDKEYFQMAEKSIQKWKAWNDLLGEGIYKEVGFLMLSKDKLENEGQTYERHSYENLLTAGYAARRMDAFELKENCPAINTSNYQDAVYNPIGGYVESGRAIELLLKYAISLGVEFKDEVTYSSPLVFYNKIEQLKTNKGNFSCAQILIAAGAHSPYLLPELKPYMKATGHPLYWLKVDNPKYLMPPYLGVFTADISNTGWYGFPYIPKLGIMKIGRHTNGTPMHPNESDRVVTDQEVADFRNFIQSTFPSLEKSPIVYTRKCLYTDTLDGHFWIDHHPEIKGLAVSTGESGHAMKMGPMLGEMTADMLERKQHQFSERYKWRHLTSETIQVEEARNIE